VLWLASRERWQAVAIWVITMLVVVFFLGALGVSLAWNLPFEVWIMWGFVGGALTLMYYLGMASQAGRFFVDARRNGLIELLLAAPLGGKEIVQGQWRALLRLFAVPVVLFLSVQLAGTALSQHTSSRLMVAGLGSVPNLAFTIATAVAISIVTAANLITLCWFGMWMGMTSKSANLATLKTLIFVQVIPWFVISFASGLIVGLFMMSAMMPALKKTGTPNTASLMAWFPLVSVLLTCALSLAKDFFLWAMARRKLYANFRDMAVRAVVPIQFAVPPPPATAAVAPPVIAAQP
jgi:hypothetical protein